MLPLPDLEVYAGLIALFCLCVPAGAALLRIGERFIGRRVALTPVERLLIAFYGVGGVLFALASIPAPLYGTVSVAAVLVVGGAGYTAFAVFERGRGLRTLVQFVASPAGMLLGLASLGLLAIEVVGGSLVLPNGIDGAVDSLFVNRLLALHTVPWTLQPYASDGVIYPQGTAIWFSLPVLLFGWPIVSAPVVLPPLFLSLTPPAAFCLGERLRAPSVSRTPWTGLVFAGFFTLVASWPRLYVGGSYDFILGMPLFLLVLGLIRSFGQGRPSWRESLLFGILLGVTLAVSTTVGTALALLLVGRFLWVAVRDRSGTLARAARLLASLAVAGVFVVRSLVGIAMWWSYPGHVMSSNSVPPYSPLASQATYGGGLLTQVDPFVPWKYKVSPFPVLAIELQVLLAVGLVLSAVVLARPRGSLARSLPRDTVAFLVFGTAVLFSATEVVALLGAWNTSLSGIQSVTNLWELSILTFMFYSLLAILPLVAGTNYLRDRWGLREPNPTASARSSRARSSRPSRRRSSNLRVAGVVAVVVLAVPLAAGMAVTTSEVPGFLHVYLKGQSNGTQDDILALQWAGAHLPGCSGVLVAPGSAAQFLPEYTGSVRIIYPAYPIPTNLTYYTIVRDLSEAIYGPITRAGMLELGVTEVFVTGATTNSYPAFSTAPLSNSSDFSQLFTAGDASVWAFEPGVSDLNCSPT